MATNILRAWLFQHLTVSGTTFVSFITFVDPDDSSVSSTRNDVVHRPHHLRALRLFEVLLFFFSIVTNEGGGETIGKLVEYNPKYLATIIHLSRPG